MAGTLSPLVSLANARLANLSGSDPISSLSMFQQSWQMLWPSSLCNVLGFGRLHPVLALAGSRLSKVAVVAVVAIVAVIAMTAPQSGFTSLTGQRLSAS